MTQKTTDLDTMTEDLDILEGEHLENSATGTEMVRADANKPDTLFLLPVKERPFFPGQTLPIILDKAVWGDTFKKIIKEGIHYLGIIYVDAEDHSKAIPEDFAQTGTLIRIHDPKIK